MGKRKRRRFRAEYKVEVVKLIYASGKSVGQVAKELDLTETSVRAWVKRAGIDEKRDPKRWHDGQMIVRWTATAMREASTRFRRIAGHKDLPKLLRALRGNETIERQESVA